MKIATVAPEGTPWEKQLKQFKRYVEEGSQGRIQVKMFMGGSLGGEKALVRRTSQGTIQVFGGSAAAIGSLVPELDVIESPYLFDTVEQADRALDAPATRAQISGLLTKRGFTFGFWAENGFRSWYTKEKQIRTPADAVVAFGLPAAGDTELTWEKAVDYIAEELCAHPLPRAA